LSPQQKIDRDALLVAQFDPASPSYHKWLTPEEYAARFGAKAVDIARTRAWLAQQGLDVRSTSPLGARVNFAGRVADVQTAFRTEMHAYKVGNETHYAMSTAPAIPPDLEDDESTQFNQQLPGVLKAMLAPKCDGLGYELFKGIRYRSSAGPRCRPALGQNRLHEFEQSLGLERRTSSHRKYQYQPNSVDIGPPTGRSVALCVELFGCGPTWRKSGERRLRRLSRFCLAIEHDLGTTKIEHLHRRGGLPAL